MRKRGLGFTLSYKENEGLYLHQQKLTQETFLCLRKMLTLLWIQATLGGLFTMAQDGLQACEQTEAQSNG